ncbi:MAG: hypothetical protein ACHQ6T_13470, partial [Myxococcota bacterium]
MLVATVVAMLAAEPWTTAASDSDHTAEGATILLAAGDIGDCDRLDGAGAHTTTKILEGIEGTIAALGDLVYPAGTAQAFRDWLGPDVKTAIAYAWPGIDNSWIKPFVQIARSAGITSVVAIASLP